jgi:hypothetical protein
MKLTTYILHYRFIVLNLLFGLYLWLVQPGLLARMQLAASTHQPDWLIGGLVIGSQVFEMIGLYLKGPLNTYFAQRFPPILQKGSLADNTRIAVLVLAPIFHLCFSVLLSLVAFEMCFPAGGAESSMVVAWLPVILVFAVIFKEAFVIISIISVGTGNGAILPPPYSLVDGKFREVSRPRSIDQITLKDVLLDSLGDLLLLAFSTVAFTASWDFITSISPIQQTATVYNAYLGATIFFFMVFVGTRSTYIMQELATHQSRWNRVIYWFSLGIMWLASLWSVPSA